MEDEIKPPQQNEFATGQAQKDYLLPVSILISAVILAGAWVYTAGLKSQQNQSRTKSQPQTNAVANILEEKVLPPEGIMLPVRWGDLGVKMVGVGVVDGEKFEQLYASRGGLTEEMKAVLYGENNGNLKITSENSGMILNLLWALGLGTKNDILEAGPMTDKGYGGAGNFASTGGWTLAKGDSSTSSEQAALAHYSRHPFIVLTQEQQGLVERVAKNIYRPCCNNPTHFPDCNHGMAMLGLLELMASQNIPEEEMYKVALQVNSYWFPDAYLAIAQYLELQGISWDKADPKEILGYEYSGASGYQKILNQITPPERKGGGSCGI